MTTRTQAPDTDRSVFPDPGAGSAFRSELLKLRSVSSIGTMLLVAVALTALLSLVGAHAQSVSGPSFMPAGQDGVGSPNQTLYPVRIDPTGTILAGNILGAALFGAFGAIAGALEYSSGMIRVSLAAVPRRARFFLCKTAAVASTAVVAAAVCTLVCFLIGESYFSGHAQESVGLTTPGVPLHLAGAVLCLAGWALIGFALGMLLRSTALGVTCAFGVYIGAPLLAETIDPNVANDITPTQTGEALWTFHDALNSGIAPFGLALAVFLGYVLVLGAAAFARVCRTDA